MTTIDTRALLDPWVAFGLAAQGCFAARFIYQWLVSERRGRSTVPLGFWFLSLGGGIMLFIYATHRRDPVFMLGQGMGIFIYVRNLMLIFKRRSLMKRRHPALMNGSRQISQSEPVTATAE